MNGERDAFDFSDFQSTPTEASSASRQPSGSRGAGYPIAAFGDDPSEPWTAGASFSGEEEYAAPAGHASAGAPALFLGLTTATLVVAVVVSFLPGGWVTLLGGWVLAGPVAFSLLSVFSLRDTAARARTYYSGAPWTMWAYKILIVGALFVSLLCAWRCADWVGHR